MKPKAAVDFSYASDENFRRRPWCCGKPKGHTGSESQAGNFPLKSES